MLNDLRCGQYCIQQRRTFIRVLLYSPHRADPAQGGGSSPQGAFQTSKKQIPQKNLYFLWKHQTHFFRIYKYKEYILNMKKFDEYIFLIFNIFKI